MATERESVRKAVRQLQKRWNRTIWIQNFFGALGMFLLWGSLVLLVWEVLQLLQGQLTLRQSWQESPHFWIWLTTLVSCSLVGSALVALWLWQRQRLSLYEAAILVDHERGLKDTLATSIYFSESGQGGNDEVVTTIHAQAKRVLDKVESYSPRHRPWKPLLRKLFLGILLAAATVGTTGFVAPVSSLHQSPKEETLPAAEVLEQASREIQKEAEKKKLPEGVKVAKLLKKAAKEVKKAPKGKRSEKLRKWEKKLDSLRREVEKKLWQKALRQAIKALKEHAKTQDVAKSLEKKDFASAQKKAQQLAKKAEKNPKSLLKQGEKGKKLAKASRKAARALEKTKLDELAKTLKKLANLLDPQKKKPLSGKASQLAKGQKAKAEQLRKLLAKGQKAFQKAQQLLKKSFQPAPKNLPTYKGPLPKAKAKLAKSPSQPPQGPPPPPSSPKNQQQGQGQNQQAKQWTGPCDFTCPYSGQCMKCPCRLNKGICAYTKKKCKCRYCQQATGGGQGQGGAQGALAQGAKAQPVAGKSAGQRPGGKSAGKQAAGLNLKDPTKNKNRGRRTQIRGRMQKTGKTVIMAIRAFQKEKTSVEYQKAWSVEKAALEDAFRKLKLPLELRQLVQKYFDAIKPKE